jgi:hypothetical protein
MWRGYREEPCVFLTGDGLSGSAGMRVMDSKDAPVSTFLELARLTIRAFRYFAGTLRCGLVSKSGLFFIAVFPLGECNCTP